MKSQQIPALAGLRGLAALWVFLGHYTGIIQTVFGLPIIIFTLFSQGWIAVELFFILSGFIMVHAHPLGAQTWAAYSRFVHKRFARIWPVHILVLSVCWLMIGAHEWGHTPSLFDYVRSITLTHAWWNYNHAIWNDPSWSLSAEWGAYLTFPLCFLLMKVKKPGLWMLLGSVGYAVFNAFLSSHNLHLVVESGLLRAVPCFALGVLAYRYRQLNPHIDESAADILGFITFLALICGDGTWEIVPLLLFWLLALSYGKGRIAGWLGKPVMQFMGKISFALYMVHYPLLQILIKAIGGMDGLKAMETFPAAAFVMGLWFITIGVAIVIHKYVEIPSQKWLTK